MCITNYFLMNNFISYACGVAPQWFYVTLLLIFCVVAIWIFSVKNVIRIKLRRLLGVMYVEYLLLLLCSTIIFRDRATCSIGLEFVPLWNLAYISQTETQLELLLNILMFVPVGFCSSVFLKHPVATKIILLSMTLSCTIELSQYFLEKGFCETNDVINNTLGGMIGYLIYKAPFLSNSFAAVRASIPAPFPYPFPEAGQGSKIHFSNHGVTALAN